MREGREGGRERTELSLFQKGWGLRPQAEHSICPAIISLPMYLYPSKAARTTFTSYDVPPSTARFSTCKRLPLPPIRRRRCSRSGCCGLARARRQTPPCAGCSRAPRATFTPSSAHRASRSRHVKSTSSSACCCTPTLYNHGTRRNEIKSQPYFRLACCGRWRLPPQPPSSRCPIVVVCCEVGWVFSCSHLFL